MPMDQPGLDGLEVFRRVLAEAPGQRAIIASGFSKTERSQAALQLGASAFVSKPYTLVTIAEAVRAALEK